MVNTDPSGLDIDVSDLSSQRAAAWFRRVGVWDDSCRSGDADGVAWPDGFGLAGRWLGLRAYQRGDYRGAIAARIHRDGTADVLPPACHGRFDPRLATALLQQAATELADRRIQLAVMYLPIDATALHACAGSARFQRGGDLQVLTRSVGFDDRPLQLGDWTFQPCAFGGRDDLPGVFQRTLIGSRDFPALPQIGSIRAMLARFAEVGFCDNRMWYLTRYRQRLAGCLLMTARGDCQVGELLYFGLMPEYRGRGGGRIMVRYALDTAGDRGLPAVMAGVDAENDVAIAVYASMGFDPASRRGVFFRQLATEGDVSPYVP
jgi:ribosomal protein S18 acetylase RimI-like enzyme